MAGLVDKIKSDVKKAGTNKSKFIYFREGVKQRVRFLTDMDDGIEVVFHDSYEKNINVPCQEIFGRDCPYCEEEGLRTRSLYAWPVYNYETKEVQIFMFAVNNCSPVPALMAMYETYGTICDRDYVISVSGRQQNKTYSVVPMDKVKFRNEKAKPLSEKAMLKAIDKAYPCDEVDDDEEEQPKRSKGKKSNKAKDTSYNDDDDKLPPTDELEEMKPQDLYNMCRERDIDAKPKKNMSYYVGLLEEWRSEHESEDDYDDGDWGDGDDEDTPDYESMSPRELYDLCKERDIDVQPKKPAKYYIKQLEEYDKAKSDWGDGEDGDWEEDGNDDDWEE